MEKEYKERSSQLMKQMVENCTFVKTVLMLTVVLYHSIVFWGGGWFSAIKPMSVIIPIVYLSKWLNSFHVYGFTFTSGYLYSFLRFEQGKYQEYKVFIKSKARRLLIPYAFIALLWVIPIGQIFFHNSISILIDSYLLGISPSQLWFLLMLFWVFAIIWWLSEQIQRSVGISIIIACCFWGAGYLGAHFIENYFMIWGAFRYIPVFIMGMKLRDIHVKGRFLCIKAYEVILLFALDIVLFVIQQFITAQDDLLSKIIGIPIELILHLVGALMIFYVLQYWGTKVMWRNSKLFMEYTKISMIVYLIHQQLIYFSIAAFNGSINPFLNMVINCIVALVVAYFIAKLLMSNKYTKYLVGEK